MRAAYETATKRQSYHREQADAAARDRALALEALHTRAGMSYDQISALLGISAARVGQMLRALAKQGSSGTDSDAS